MGQKINKEPINNSCPICLLEVTSKDYNMGCNHYIHRECAILSISDIIREKKKKTCFFCRKEIKRKYLTELIYGSKNLPLQLFELITPTNWVENHVIEYFDVKSYYIYFKKIKMENYSILIPLIKKNGIIIPFYINSPENILFDLKEKKFRKFGLEYNHVIELKSKFAIFTYHLISFIKNYNISLKLLNKYEKSSKRSFYIKEINKCKNINIDDGTITNGLDVTKFGSLHLQFRSFIIIYNSEPYLFHEISNFFTY